MATVEDRMFTRRVVDFTAKVHRACPCCGAPGQYLDDPKWIATYPNIYNPKRRGEAVGPICPHCGQDRPLSTERRTKRKEWWVFRLPNWLARLSSLVSRQP